MDVLLWLSEGWIVTESEKIKVLMETLIHETENCKFGTSEELIQALVQGISNVKGINMQANKVVESV